MRADRRVRSLHGESNKSSVQEWHIDSKINECPISALADTGANINAISKDEADRIGLLPKPGTAGNTIRLPSGRICASLGTTSLRFNFKGEKKVHFLACNIVEKLESGMVLCYEFLRETKTLTDFFKNRIKEVMRFGLQRFSLCLLDDHGSCSGARARMVGFINGTRVSAVPDTGSGIMAVSASYAKRLGLKVDTNHTTHVAFADGSSAMTSGTVEAAWNFLPPQTQTEGPWDHDWDYQWHVIEDLPADAILSLEFIKQHNVFSRHEHAFVSSSPRSKLAEIFGIHELPGGNEELSNLAAQFETDLTSPDPFTYNMLVRENARRCEIQRKICDLPPDTRAAMHDREQKRIEAWERIHHAKQTGDADWSRLRDEYLSSLPRPAQFIRPQASAALINTMLNGQSTKSNKFWRWLPRRK
ncbi:hypothetical protein F4808DRAFT_461919 [Astrocystis sublimbata]|nr:hypothetical protein F4808DRAFT_461919 [Astrocystis sublimbata]